MTSTPPRFDPPPSPGGGCRGINLSVANSVLVRLATLLGTYSLAGNTEETDSNALDRNDDGGDGRTVPQFAATCSGEALRSLLSPRAGDAPSSFPSLLLDSDPYHHHHHHHHPHSEKKEELEAFASSNLARPIVVFARPLGKENSPNEIDQSSERGSETESAAGTAMGEVNTVSNVKFTSDKHVLDTNEENKEDTLKNIRREDSLNQNVNTPNHEENNVVADTPHDSPITEVDDFAAVPHLLLRNLSSSFALLVDARIRAYGTILAGHASSLAGDGSDPTYAPDDCDTANGGCDECEEGCSCHVGISCVEEARRKLSALVLIGEGVGVDSVVTAMRACRSQEGDHAKQLSLEDESGRVTLPLMFEVVADVGVPNPAMETRNRLSVSMQAPGTIQGCFQRTSLVDGGIRLVSIHVELDTHALLASMIERACEIVSKAIENVAAASSSSSPGEAEAQNGIGLGDKGDEMPELPSTSGMKAEFDQGPVLSPKPRRPSVVSPDLGSVADKDASEHVSVAPLELDRTEDDAAAAEDSCEEEDRCAALVDYVMEEVDLPQSPPARKRARRGSHSRLAQAQA